MTDHDNTYYRREARILYPEDEIQIDGTAEIDEWEGGAWVAAWVWVPAPEPEE